MDSLGLGTHSEIQDFSSIGLTLSFTIKPEADHVRIELIAHAQVAFK
jgi:hypothetical protein